MTDETSKEVIHAAAEVMLRPIAKVLEDGIAVMGGDKLAEYRETQKERRRIRRERIGASTLKLLVERGVEERVQPHEPTIEAIFEGSQDENRPELQDLWVRLLAAAIDPSRSARVRHEFIEAVKKLEPLDAVLLASLNRADASTEANAAVAFAGRLIRQVDEVAVSLAHLAQLECVANPTSTLTDRFNPHHRVHLLPFGRELLRALYT